MKLSFFLLLAGVLAAAQAQKPELRGSTPQTGSSIRERMSGLVEKLGLSSRERGQGAVFSQPGMYDRNQGLEVDRSNADLRNVQRTQGYDPREVSRTDMRQQNLEAYRDSVSSKVDQLSRDELMKFSDIFEAPVEQQSGRSFQQPVPQDLRPMDTPMDFMPALEELDKFGDKFADIKAKLKPHGKGDKRYQYDRRLQDSDAPMDLMPAAEELDKFGDKFADIKAKLKPHGKGEEESQHDRRLQDFFANPDLYGAADPWAFGGVGVNGVGVAGVGVAGVGVAGVGVAGVGVAGVASPFSVFNAGLPNNLRYFGGCYQRFSTNAWGCMGASSLNTIFNVPSGVVFFNGHWCRRTPRGFAIIYSNGRCWAPPLRVAAVGAFASPYGLQTTNGFGFGVLDEENSEE